jgi:aspartyl-tRNA(Asn)/glutamyl-tRNA(Gln) amidotransferase subunit C
MRVYYDVYPYAKLISVAIARDELLKLGELARISLEDAEIEGIDQDVNRLIEYLSVLSQLDLNGLDMSPHSVDSEDVLRDDLPQPGLSRNEAISQAPETSAGLFIVPSILE